MADRTTEMALRNVEGRILRVRGQRVMLDRDLAHLYGVATNSLNRAVRRNLARFPKDFSFVVPRSELENLKCQTGTSSSHGGRRKPVRVFAEHGVAMLSSVLRSSRAVRVNIAIMRAFVRLRGLAAAQELLGRRLLEIEGNCDSRYRERVGVLQRLTESERAKRRERIGFHPARARSAREPVRSTS